MTSPEPTIITTDKCSKRCTWARSDQPCSRPGEISGTSTSDSSCQIAPIDGVVLWNGEVRQFGHPTIATDRIGNMRGSLDLRPDAPRPRNLPFDEDGAPATLFIGTLCHHLRRTKRVAPILRSPARFELRIACPTGSISGATAPLRRRLHRESMNLR